MKIILTILSLTLLLFATSAQAQDVGLFFRTDCNTLEPVALSTYCGQTTTTVDRSAGLYVYNGSTWVSAASGTGGSGTPGGADTQVQYNSVGAFAGDAGMTYNAGTDTLTVGTVAGALSGNASTASALAANGANCTAGNYPLGVDASGAVESCTAITATPGGADTQVQFNDGGNLGGDAGMTFNKATNVLTVTGGVVGNASTSTALAANGANCSAGSAPLGVDASGAVESCFAVLPLAGGTLTGQLITDNLGIEFEESDTNPTCAAGNYNIFADLSETKFKKCTNGVATDLSPAEVQTLANVLALGRTDTTATSTATSVKIGDTNWQLSVHGDASDGIVTQCYNVSGNTYNQCDHIENVADTFNWILKLNGVTAETITSAGVHSYNALKPKGSVYWPAGALSTDGTQCAAPGEVTINSGSKRWTIICADNDSSTIYGEVAMPDSWDGGTVTLMGMFVQTAANTSAMNSDVAMACRAAPTTINNTWGTEVAMDITNMTGSNAINTVTTAAITPNGTCTGGGMLLQFRWQLDATGTTTAVATLHMLGFKLEYSKGSRSD